MPSESDKEEVNKDHIEMWKHYDILRQRKNGTFLTANTILAAIAGLSADDPAQLLLAISAVGTIIGIAWFLLLTRNTAYITYHRKRAGPDWTPVSWTPRSSVLDRSLPVAFGAFWVILLVQQLGGSV